MLIQGNYLHDIGRTNNNDGGGNPLNPHDQNLYLEGTIVTVLNNTITLNAVGAGGWGAALKVGGSYYVQGNTFSGKVGNSRTGQIVIGDDLHNSLSNFNITGNTFTNPLTVAVVTCGVALSGSNFITNNTATGTGVTAVYGGEICSGSTGLGTITNTGNTPA